MICCTARRWAGVLALRLFVTVKDGLPASQSASAGSEHCLVGEEPWTAPGLVRKEDILS